MITWFINQKKEIKIGIFAVLIILFFGIRSAYWKHQYSKGLENQIKELISQNKALQRDIEALDFQKKMLQTDIDKKTMQLKHLQEQAKNKKDERTKIPDVVRAFPDAKLDSLLTNYRHIPRSKD